MSVPPKRVNDHQQGLHLIATEKDQNCIANCDQKKFKVATEIATEIAKNCKKLRQNVHNPYMMT